MVDFSFPSDSFPPPPVLTLSAAEHWVPHIAPGAVLAVVWPREEGRFTPNVVVTATRFGAAYEFDVAVDALQADLGQLTDVEVTIRDRGELMGVPAYLQEVVFTEPAAGTLIQFNLVFLVRHGPVADLVHVVGTAAGDRLEPDYAEVREIVQSVAFTIEG
jgi:hypothetical protein